MDILKRSLLFLITAAFLLTTLLVDAHNKVVVIPLGTDIDSVHNVITVAPKGGDFTQVQAAIDSIDDASKSNPYIVFIAPGEYSLQRTLIPKSYVSLVGSGQGVTTLFGQRASSAGPSCGGRAMVTINEFYTYRISDLSLVHRAVGNESVVGICNSDLTGGGVILKNVALSVTMGINNTGIYSAGGSVSVTDSSITIGGRPNSVNNIGIFGTAGGTAVGLYNSTVTVYGDNNAYAIFADDLSANPQLTVSYYVRNTSLVGDVVVKSGAFNSVEVVNSDLYDVNNTGSGTFKAYHSIIRGTVSDPGTATCLATTSDTAELNNSCVAAP
ncbi:glycosyl hydrolase family 28-related protein [Arenicella xantha]|uniref:Pectate lyase-like protein n=1 Tax=Arenicella xantha TaxID=644221 RepID=A0A395JH11_9GAMM|nr:glycosyl hydrolase family 28-related protein [Arenicella xantha]RBP48735.1 pectate lyase-like protein [Arenicella xantha]